MSKHAQCGVDCSECGLLTLCFGCYKIPNVACSVHRCYSRGECLLGLDGRCGTCIMRWGCPKVSSRPSRKIVDEFFDKIESFKGVKVKRLREFPPHVPIINLSGKTSDILKAAKPEAVVIRYYDLLNLPNREEFLTEASSKGIHKKLPFEGIVILSSIMPDELLRSPTTFKNFREIAKEIGVDAVLAWDQPVYRDHPYGMSWTNLLRSIEGVISLAGLNVPVISLVKGGIPSQIEFCVKTLSELGFIDMALHASEYIRLGRLDILEQYLKQIANYADRIAIVGASNPSVIKSLQGLLPEKTFSFWGYGWYSSAERYVAYASPSHTDLKKYFLECDCPLCKKASPNELIKNPIKIAIHNLNFLQGFLGQRPLPSTKTYDLILQRERAIIVSDLHIWTPWSLYADCLDFLAEEKPDYVIFLGDTFDFQKGQVLPLRVKDFFNGLSQIESTSIPVFGSHDGSLYGIIETVKKFLYPINSQPIFSMFEPVPSIKRSALVSLLRFYTSAKYKLMIKTSDGTVIEASHGSILDNYAKSKQDYSDSLSLMSRVEKSADWLIMAHTHIAGIDFQKHLANTGCWYRKGIELREYEDLKPTIRTAVIIEKDGTLHLSQLS